MGGGGVEVDAFCRTCRAIRSAASKVVRAARPVRPSRRVASIAAAAAVFSRTTSAWASAACRPPRLQIDVMSIHQRKTPHQHGSPNHITSSTGLLENMCEVQ